MTMVESTVTSWASTVGAWKYAVMFESVLGYLLLALFIVILARKLIR
ncbi:MAG: hypothetical protein ACOWWR_02995 [Eubacteriales bacterium]